MLDLDAVPVGSQILDIVEVDYVSFGKTRRHEDRVVDIALIRFELHVPYFVRVSDVVAIFNIGVTPSTTAKRSEKISVEPGQESLLIGEPSAPAIRKIPRSSGCCEQINHEFQVLERMVVHALDNLPQFRKILVALIPIFIPHWSDEIIVRVDVF